MKKPPLPSLVVAAGSHEADVLVPLTDVEESLAADGQCLDVVLSLEKGSVDDRLLSEALAKALEILPECAGRYVRRFTATEHRPEGRLRTCILCNNGGALFRSTDCEGPAPDPATPLPASLVDRAEGAQPTEEGGPGGPLLRARLLSFSDGQVLVVSMAQGLADAGGVALLLRVWAGLYKGEPSVPPVSRKRLDLEAAVRGFCPRLEPAFGLLHRIEDLRPRSSEAKPVLSSFVMRTKELDELSASMSADCRKRRLIYDSETFTGEEMAYALVIRVLGAALPASMWLDYRETFVCPRHFGVACGEIDLDLPQDPGAAAAAIRKKPLVAEKRDFWSWKVSQSARPTTNAQLVLCSWAGAAAADAVGFGSQAARSFAPGASFWQEWVDRHGKAVPSFVLLTPHPEGLQVQALLPREVASRMFAERKATGCQVWHAA